MLVVGDHTGPVTALTFLPDGGGLVSGSKDGSVPPLGPPRRAFEDDRRLNKPSRFRGHQPFRQ